MPDFKADARNATREEWRFGILHWSLASQICGRWLSPPYRLQASLPVPRGGAALWRLLEQCLLFLGWPDSPSSLHHHWHFSIEQSPDRSNRSLLSVGYGDFDQLGFRNLEQR